MIYVYDGYKPLANYLAFERQRAMKATLYSPFKLMLLWIHRLRKHQTQTLTEKQCELK